MFSVANIGLLLTIVIGLITIGTKIFDIGKKVAKLDTLEDAIKDIKNDVHNVNSYVDDLEKKINVLDAAQKQQAVEITHLKEHIRDIKNKG